MRSSKRALLRLLALLLAFVMVAAACGSDDEEEAGGDDDAAAVTDDTAADETAEDEADDAPAEDAEEEPADDAPADDADMDPVQIGLIAQDEELFSAPEVRAAAQAYVDFANEELDGADGHPIELVICGAGDSPESHVACAQEFINSDIPVIVNGGLPGLGTATSETLATEGVPSLPLGNDFTEYFLPGTVVIDPGLPGLAQIFMVWAAQQDGLTEMTLFLGDDPAFLEFGPVLDLIAADVGITVTETIPLGFEPDLTGPVSAANADNPVWLFVLLDGAQCSAAASAVQTVGYEGQVMANDLCMAEDVVSSGDLDGWVGAVVSAAQTADGADVDEINRIIDTYGGDDAQTGGLAGWALAATQAARELLITAGGADADRASVTDAMATYASADLLGMPDTISCPGPGDWIAACNQAPLVVLVDGGQVTVPDGFVELDFTSLDFLLG